MAGFEKPCRKGPKGDAHSRCGEWLIASGNRLEKPWGRRVRLLGKPRKSSRLRFGEAPMTSLALVVSSHR